MTLQNNFFGQFSKHNKLGNHENIMINLNEYLVVLVYFSIDLPYFISYVDQQIWNILVTKYPSKDNVLTLKVLYNYIKF